MESEMHKISLTHSLDIPPGGSGDRGKQKTKKKSEGHFHLSHSANTTPSEKSRPTSTTGNEEKKRKKRRTPKMFMVAVDASENAVKAFEFVLDLAHTKDVIVIVTVPKRVKDTYKGRGSYEEERKFKQLFRNQEASTLVHSFGQRCVEQGVGCKEVVTECFSSDKRPEKVIQEQVDFYKPDLLVVGSRGIGFMKKMVLGSVSDYLVKNSSCAVCVVR